MTFRPGVDPNRALVPPGRPAGLHASIEARFGRGGDDCWDYLTTVLNGTAETVQEKVLADGRIVEYRVRPTIAERAAAAELILAYAHGKPTQTAVIKDERGDSLGNSDLKERVAAILAKHTGALPAPVTVEGEFTVTAEPKP